MKTSVTYGFFMALGWFLLTLILFFLGLHSDPAKLQSAQWILMGGGIVITVICLVLGTKARAAETPVTEDFTYGKAFMSGFMIALFGGLFAIATTILYGTVINPNFTDIQLQAQALNLEAKGVSQDKIDQIQRMSAMWMKPPIQAAFGFIFGLIFNTIISLITSAFLKRAAVEDLTTAEPPPVA
jgi:hypothetical protein